MPKRCSLSGICLAIVATIGATSAVAQPLPGREEAITRVPQFVVHAVKFQVVDETGWDWTGSDEVHAVFVDFNANKERATSVYAESDAGDTVEFRDQDRCIAPQPNCNGAASLSFGVAFWEKDWTPAQGITGCNPSLVTGHPWYNRGICPGDDLIGRATVAFSPLQLLSSLPSVGHTIERAVTLSGGSGLYTFTYRITRLPDIERPIVREPLG